MRYLLLIIVLLVQFTYGISAIDSISSVYPLHSRYCTGGNTINIGGKCCTGTATGSAQLINDNGNTYCQNVGRGPSPSLCYQTNCGPNGICIESLSGSNTFTVRCECYNGYSGPQCAMGPPYAPARDKCIDINTPEQGLLLNDADFICNSHQYFDMISLTIETVPADKPYSVLALPIMTYKAGTIWPKPSYSIYPYSYALNNTWIPRWSTPSGYRYVTGKMFVPELIDDNAIHAIRAQGQTDIYGTGVRFVISAPEYPLRVCIKAGTFCSTLSGSRNDYTMSSISLTIGKSAYGSCAKPECEIQPLNSNWECLTNSNIQITNEYCKVMSIFPPPTKDCSPVDRQICLVDQNDDVTPPPSDNDGGNNNGGNNKNSASTSGLPSIFVAVISVLVATIII